MVSFIIQGSFPGGIPYSSVIKRIVKLEDNLSRHLLQRKTPFNQQRDNGNRLIEIDPHRLNLKTPGNPLPGKVMQRMQSFFNTDFSDVRIHVNDGQAESIGALAFTTGNDIYFAHNQYNPNSPHGQRLLVHELTHVVQQKSGRIKNNLVNGITVINNPGLEAEAERYSIQTKSIVLNNNFNSNLSINNRIIQLLYTAAKLPKSKKNNELLEFPMTICVIKSEITGQFYLGINGKRNYDKIVNKVNNGGGNKSEKEIVKIIATKDPHGYKGGTANCAEVDALMEAIDNGESPHDLGFSCIQRGNLVGGQNQGYYPAKPCGNCQKWLEFKKDQDVSITMNFSKVQDFDIGEEDDFNILCKKIYAFGFKSHI